MQLTKSPQEIKSLPLAFDQHTELTLRNPAALAQRDALLEQSQNIERVVSPASQKAAVEMLSQITDMAKAAEKSRKEVKGPFTALCKLIEDVATKFISPLDAEKNRLKGELVKYQAELDRQAAEERKKLEAEKLRLEQEARRQAEEAARKQRELEEQALKARSDAEAQRLAQQAAAIAQEQQLQASQIALQQAALVKVADDKPEGISVKRPWKFRVLDMAALYKARPDLCNEPTPKTAEINRLIAGDSGLRSLPGLEIYQDLNVAAR